MMRNSFQEIGGRTVRPGEILIVRANYRLGGASAERPGRWWGSAVRGSLGRAWLQILCQRPGQVCEACELRDSCRYPAIWNPQKSQPEDPGPAFRPAPYRMALNLAREGELRVSIWIYGGECRFGSQWASALDLAMLRYLEVDGGVTPQGAVKLLTPRPLVSSLPSQAGDALLLRLRSPLRLITNGQPLRRPPSFSALVKAIHRRISICAKSWGWPSPPPLSEQERRLAFSVREADSRVCWAEYERYSSRQGRSMRLGGLEGFLRFEGPWQILWPRLQPAQVLGLGRLTTMGFGDVRWEVPHARPPAPSTGTRGMDSPC